MLTIDFNLNSIGNTLAVVISILERATYARFDLNTSLGISVKLETI